MSSLNEQNYTNLNKQYYHGYRVMDPSLKSCEEFYLTNSFLYAASYAGRKGHVDVYKLKKSANIFKLQSEFDFNLLQNNLKDSSINLEELKERDWYSYFKGNIRKRRDLLDIVESLGYDGYFNREVDKELMKHSVAANISVDRRLYNSPSLGIFNKNCLLKIDEVLDVVNDSRVQDYKDLELDYIKYRLLDAYKNNISLSDVYNEVTEQVLNFNSIQIMSLFSKFNYKDFENEYSDLCKRFGDIELLTEKKLIYYQRPIVRW